MLINLITLYVLFVLYSVHSTKELVTIKFKYLTVKAASKPQTLSKEYCVLT